MLKEVIAKENLYYIDDLNKDIATKRTAGEQFVVSAAMYELLKDRVEDYKEPEIINSTAIANETTKVELNNQDESLDNKQSKKSRNRNNKNNKNNQETLDNDEKVDNLIQDEDVLQQTN